MFRPEQSYLIVGHPRSGSSVLCAALTATGVLGHPQEYFWRLVEGRHAAELGLEPPTDDNYEAYLEAVLKAGTTPNGVFAAKLFWEHAKDLTRRTGLIEPWSGLQAIQRLWAPFGPDVRVVLVRRNCLRSAVSLWRATTTNVWARLPGDPPAAAPPLDVYALSVAHAELHAADLGWPGILRAAGIEPLVITYDQIASDLASVVRSIAGFVEVEINGPVSATFEQQADRATESYIDDWNAMTGGCKRCRTGR